MATKLVCLRYPCFASMLLLSACATHQSAPAAVPAAPATGDASWAMKTPAGAQRYQLATGDIATGADLAASVAPIYPAGLLPICPPPQEVQALVIVDKAGKVSGVRIAGDAHVAGSRGPFVLATRKAVMQWRFNPLQIQHDALDAAGNPVVISETRPFSLTYLFHFACHEGTATVTSNTTTPDHS